MGDLKEIKQWRKKANPHIFALEPRILFDGASADQKLDQTNLNAIDVNNLNLHTEQIGRAHV